MDVGIAIVVGILATILLSLGALIFYTVRLVRLRRELKSANELHTRLLSVRAVDRDGASIAETQHKIHSLQKRIGVARLFVVGSGGIFSLTAVGVFGLTRLSMRAAMGVHRLTEPVWNVWADSSKEIDFKPEKVMTHHKYSLVVNLAAIKFREFGNEVMYSRGVSSGFASWLERNADLDSKEIRLLIFPDDQYFKPQAKSEEAKTVRLDLGLMRKVRRSGFVLNEPPLQTLRQQRGKAEFSFGLTSFQIETTDRSGVGWIAIAIWASGKPVDEISVPLCIREHESDACPEELVQSSSPKSVDLASNPEQPNATLDLIERGPEIVGTFRCNVCNWPDDRNDSWVIPESAKWMSDRFREITQTIGAASGVATDQISQRSIQTAGDDIYNIIFLHSHDPKIRQAQASFADFISRARSSVEQGESPRSLFVRLVPSEPDLVLAPVGLMRMPLTDSREFVGFDVDVQTPLEYQDYSSSGKCISEWLLFVPPYAEKPPLYLKDVSEAREAFGKWIDAFKNSCSSCVMDSEDHFQDWLGQSGQPVSSVVMILSHHRENALYFNEVTGKPKILSTSITRDFTPPSLVILDACGTSEPGASEFVRAFNFHGINTVIATTTEVEPSMGGGFLAAFMDELRKHGQDGGYTVSRARFDAVSDLGNQKDSLYGPKALVFVLAGNGAVRLCLSPTDGEGGPLKQGGKDVQQ